MPRRKTGALRQRSAYPKAGAAFALTIAFAAAAALLSVLLLRSIDRSGEWQKRSAALESALAASQAELSSAKARLIRSETESEGLRASAQETERLRSEAALTREELKSVLTELERKKSLADAVQERSEALSAENDALRTAISGLRERSALDSEEIERLSVLLTKAEEALAGKEALYRETAYELKTALRKNKRSEAELLQLRESLTAVEEEYAGASALLAESSLEIERVKKLALSYYNSAQNARSASGAARPASTAGP